MNTAQETKLAPWRHLLLYLKNHYVKAPPTMDMDPLKKIVAHETGIPLDLVTSRDVYSILVGLFLQLAEPWMTRDFMNDLFKWKPTATIEEAIEKMGGLLGCIKVIENGEVILNLGDPDPAVLPLRSPEKYGLQAVRS